MLSEHWPLNKLIALLLLTWGLVPLVATAQTTPTTHDARSSGMGGCFMPDTAGAHLTLTYRSHYLLPELADKYLSAALPIATKGIATVAYSHRGNSDYLRQRVAAGYSLSIASKLRGGVALGIDHIGSSHPNYTPQWHAKAEAYLCASMGNGLSFTLLASTHPESLTPNRRWLAQVAHVSPQLTSLAELELTDRWRVRLGAEYNFRQTLFVRAGLSTSPLVVSFGAGARFRHYSFNLGAEAHSVLGLSPHTSLTLWF